MRTRTQSCSCLRAVLTMCVRRAAGLVRIVVNALDLREGTYLFFYDGTDESTLIERRTGGSSLDDVYR